MVRNKRFWSKDHLQVGFWLKTFFFSIFMCNVYLVFIQILAVLTQMNQVTFTNSTFKAETGQSYKWHWAMICYHKKILLLLTWICGSVCDRLSLIALCQWSKINWNTLLSCSTKNRKPRWIWLKHRLSKHQSQPTTVLRTTPTRTINQSQIINH